MDKMKVIAGILIMIAFAGLPASVQAQSDDGLVAEWHFDVESGSVAAEEVWHKVDVGSGNYGMYDADVGQGRNDNVMRVYGANKDYHIYEYSYQEGAWYKMDIGSGVSGDLMTGVSVGIGRYDGVIRVYGSQKWSYNRGSINEFTFSGDTWTRVGKCAGNSMWGVALGDGRNDGMPRVYGANGNYDGSIYEFTYWMGEFNSVRIAITEDIIMRAVAVGSGRNDGFNRVYGANYDGHIYEYTYENETWTKVDLGVVPSPMRAVSIGDGRNDGILRVYAASADGHIYEFTYSGDSWAVADIGYGGSLMHSIAIGAGRNDNVKRVYGANGDGHIYEFSYFADTWTKKDVGKGNSTMWGVAVGDGRNDEVIRVYGANEDRHIYEFSYEVGNQPPIANFAYSPADPVVNKTITFDASGSYDPDGGSITNYEWDFGDGNVTNTPEPIITHFYALVGGYIVNLTVTDNEEAKHSLTKTITTHRSTFTWTIEPPTSVIQGDDVTFEVGFSESADYYFRVENSTNGVVWRYPGTGTDTATNPVAKTWATTTSTPPGDYTIIININGVDNSDTRTVAVEPDDDPDPDSIITISAEPDTINISESATISGNIIPAHSAIVTLTFTSPAGTTIEQPTLSTISGAYRFVFPANEVGTWLVNASWAGDADHTGNTSETIPFNVTSTEIDVGYAIIIAGRNDEGLSQPYIDLTANNTYKTLLKRGFTSERIFYLNPTDQDANGDGVSDVDMISSLTNVSYTINTWAEGNVGVDIPLLIYMADHGGNDTFLVNGVANTLTASDLNSYFNELTADTGCHDIVVVYEACSSGSFVDDLSDTGRIIVTSTGIDADAGIDNTGAFFSKYFFKGISDGKAIKEAFEDASNAPEIIAYSQLLVSFGLPPQTPLLDDNGDATGHAIPLAGTGDGSLAASRYIGTQWGALDFPPTITGAIQSQKVVVGTNVNIWAVVVDDSTIEDVYATIIEPSYNISCADDTLFEMNLTTLHLEDPGADGNYTASFTLTESGNYTVIIHATDSGGNIASPKQCTITSTMLGDVNGDDERTSADAVLTLQLAASGQYNNAADVNRDGSVTSLDALMIMQACAGKIEL